MIDSIKIDPVRGNDPALRAVFAASGLPVDDLEDTGRMFFMASDGQGKVLGFGLEPAGKDVLLRSIVVDAKYRGVGIGKVIADRLLERAMHSGANRAYLLTTTADAFFESCGFVRTERDDAPRTILDSRQAASICPASAVLMVKDLKSS
jgi:N-acetylglutamate synthase-like GNAT family acetyltransferase